MANINYNFNELEKAVSALKTNPTNYTTLNRLKLELNKLFKDSQCREVIFTKNTDKIFFGMCVIPYIDGDLASKILSTDEKIRINSYYLEIDSKLLEIGLTNRELVAILLHEIGHVVNDSTPVEETRKIIDVYLSETNDHLILSDAAQYKDILAFAIKDTIRKITTMFEKNNEEILADRFVYECGYGMELESALNKIIKRSTSINRGVDNKLLVLQWTMRLYKDVKHKRIPALQTLRKANRTESSTLYKRELKVIERRLEEIDDDFMIQEAVKGFKKLYKNFKYSGMKMFEEDFYELALQVKNVDDKDEALSILRSINTRCSIIQEYLDNEDLDQKEKEKWMDLLVQYEQLRRDLSKKQTYEKYIGLFVSTPTIKSRYEY